MSRLPRSLRSGNVLLIRELPFASAFAEGYGATGTRFPRGFDHLLDGFPARRVLCSRRRRDKNEKPAGIQPTGS